MKKVLFILLVLLSTSCYVSRPHNGYKQKGKVEWERYLDEYSKKPHYQQPNGIYWERYLKEYKRKR